MTSAPIYSQESINEIEVRSETNDILHLACNLPEGKDNVSTQTSKVLEKYLMSIVFEESPDDVIGI